MLTRLRFKNFKAWKDSGDIRLAPLTVLFGTNSAGKTSIPQLLLLLKQTAESPDRQRALHFGDSRTPIDLGTFSDAIHQHDLKRPLEFDIDWQVSEPLRLETLRGGANIEGQSLGFEAKILADERRQPRVEFLKYTVKKAAQLLRDVTMKRSESGKKYDLYSDTYKFVRQVGRSWPLPEPLRFYGFPDEAIAYFQNTTFLSDLVLEVERLLKSIYYVGPLRDNPRRLYLWSGEVPEHVGLKGERAVEAILAGHKRMYNWKPRQKTKNLAQLVADRLQTMGMIDSFRVEPLGPNRKEYEVLVSKGSGLPDVKLTDVGFGVSQLLPVIVECFYVPHNSIVIFEQPEIHLHPKVQAELADLFIDAICAREDNAPRNCQFIIESHSEHFLRRLQRRIAEEKITADQAALYFIDTHEGAARIQELDVDLFGNIRNWPENFFGDEMADLVARSEAQAAKAAKAAKAASQKGNK